MPVGPVHHGGDGDAAIDRIAAFLDGNAYFCSVFHSGRFCGTAAHCRVVYRLRGIHQGR